MKNIYPLKKFIWRVTASHIISYFIAGVLALFLMKYKQLFASEALSCYMRPVDSTWVAAGPGLQFIRGIVISVVLYPFCDKILNSKSGLLYLWGLILGLSFLSTIGPAPGSLEGIIYTKLPFQYHLVGIPETLLSTFLFSWFLTAWYKKETKLFKVVSIVLVILIMFFSLAGALIGN